MCRLRTSDERGFTLVELLATMAIAGILAAIAVWSFRSYTLATAEQGTAQRIVEALRNAQSRAQAENVTYEVQFTVGSGTWTVLRLDMSGNTQVAAGSATDNSVFVQSASFTQSSGASGTDAYFYPRGTASGGQLVLARQGNPKTYTINIEGLTSRVWTS